MANNPSLPLPHNVYKPGVTLKLYKHPPPTSTSDTAELFLLDTDSLVLERSKNGRLLNCARHNIGIDPSESYDAPPLDIVLVTPLSTGLRVWRWAQVWLVLCEDKAHVARIYDPLYVEDDDDGIADIFLHVRRAVSIEARAYEKLERLQGSLIPTFIGCFVTTVKTTEDDIEWDSHPNPNSNTPPDIPKERTVYVLLLEFIPGRTLLELQPSPSSPVCLLHRPAVLRAVHILHDEIAMCGVWPTDFAERNIILKCSALADSDTAFCADASCILRSMETDVGRLNEHQPTVTLLPVAAIDLEDVRFHDAYKYRKLVESGLRQYVRLTDWSTIWL